MGLADRLITKYAARLDELIAAGDQMPLEQHSRQTSYNYLSGESSHRHYDLAKWPEFVEWRTSCITVLDQVVPATSLLRATVASLHSLGNEPSKVKFLVGFMRSIRKELEEGSLDSLVRQIEAEVLSDYLNQASAGLVGTEGERAHISAAVIAGAALERCLRTVCLALVPVEPVATDKGRPIGLSGIIDALKKRGVFNELRAKELKVWATLRNCAAHGEFEAFNRQQVEVMVEGITRFVTDHVR